MVKRMILMLAVTLVIIAALGFVKYRQIQSAIAQAAYQPPPEAVTTIVAQQETWPSTLSAIGTVAAVQGVTVSADLPGTVDRIAFDSGKWVREGEVLVELDTRQERAQLAAVEAQRDLAGVNYSRMQGLAKDGIISRADYDTAAAGQKETRGPSGGDSRDHRAKDDPGAVFRRPRPPPGEPRPVPVGGRSRSCRSSRSNPIYVNFGIPQQEAAQVRRSAARSASAPAIWPGSSSAGASPPSIRWSIPRPGTFRCRPRSPTRRASCGPACSSRPSSSSARANR